MYTPVGSLHVGTYAHNQAWEVRLLREMRQRDAIPRVPPYMRDALQLRVYSTLSQWSLVLLEAVPVAAGGGAWGISSV